MIQGSTFKRRCPAYQSLGSHDKAKQIFHFSHVVTVFYSWRLQLWRGNVQKECMYGWISDLLVPHKSNMLYIVEEVISERRGENNPLLQSTARPRGSTWRSRCPRLLSSSYSLWKVMFVLCPPFTFTEKKTTYLLPGAGWAQLEDVYTITLVILIIDCAGNPPRKKKNIMVTKSLFVLS